MSLLAFHTFVETRQICCRTSGVGHGRIVRLMSPSDLGQLIKPFVLLDLIDTPRSFLDSMAMQPHSGIAAVSVVTEGDIHFDDPDAGTGAIGYGGVKWMRAGGLARQRVIGGFVSESKRFSAMDCAPS